MASAVQQIQIVEVPAIADTEWISTFGRKLAKRIKKRDIVLDFSDTKSLSILGISWVIAMQKLSLRFNSNLTLKSVNSHLKDQLLSAKDLDPILDGESHETGFFENVGENVLNLKEELKYLLYLLSESIYWHTFGIAKKKTMMRAEPFKQMIRLGSSALGIVLMLSFLIGITLSFQSAVQLEAFGASIYMVSGICITMVSEIGPLMTAIILAGRSGSSITAEISSMVVGEEVKALETMAINPVQFLVLPRFRALTITGPLLTIISVVAGIFAGFLVSLIYLDLPPSLFIKEMTWALTLKGVLQCLTKSIVFSWIIVLVASLKGLQVSGGADSVGKATTSCVVFCISAIILADAIFSFIFYM